MDTETANDNASEVAPRIIVRIELTPDAKDKLHQIARRSGMTQVSVSSRLLEWFATQSELVQSAVLGHYPMAIQGEIARMILKQLGDGKTKFKRGK